MELPAFKPSTAGGAGFLTWQLFPYDGAFAPGLVVSVPITERP